MALVLVEVTVRVPDDAGDNETARVALAGSLVRALLEPGKSVFASAGVELVNVEGVEEVQGG